MEDIANFNRKLHEETGHNLRHTLESNACGSLELEAIAAVHELGCSVKNISGNY